MQTVQARGRFPTVTGRADWLIQAIAGGMVRPFLPRGDGQPDGYAASVVAFLILVELLVFASVGTTLMLQPYVTTAHWLAYVFMLGWPLGAALCIRQGLPVRRVQMTASCLGIAGIGFLAACTGGSVSPWLIVLIAGLATIGMLGHPRLLRWTSLLAFGVCGVLLAAEHAGLLPPDPVAPQIRGLTYLLAIMGSLAAIGQASAAAARTRRLTQAERVRFEAELVSLNQDLDRRVSARTTELQDAKIEAERANLAKSRFLAHMSHELRTPLNAVIGFAEIMQTGLFGPLGSPRYEQYAADIQASGRHLLSLVDDLLDLSRLDSGEVTLKVECVDLDEELAASRSFVAGRAEARGVTLHRDPDDLRCVTLWADRRGVRQAITNILANAVKFTDAGGRITVGVEPAGGGIAIRIADTGRGMSADKVTELLSGARGDDPLSTDENHGAGLGFAITRALLMRHGGKVMLDSKPGQGTCVRLIFPADRLASLATAAA